MPLDLRRTPTSATVPANASSRRPDVQGLRAIAVILVVAYHVGVPFGGFLGVDVFFVISGFVITGMLAREWSTTGRLDLGRFYLRRFQRLTPAVAVVVAVTIVVSTFLLSPLGGQATAAETGIGALLISGNFVIAKTTGGYFDAPAALNPLLHTWSLSVEEQFYLIFPVTLLVAWMLARRWRHLRFAAAGAVVIVFVVSLALALGARAGWAINRRWDAQRDVVGPSDLHHVEEWGVGGSPGELPLGEEVADGAVVMRRDRPVGPIPVRHWPTLRVVQTGDRV